ncbi:MAG: Coenzyme F420 hydrogenase/dehydrogenase, beta subunit C-terminal domain [Euryarchaeota archaeon]|nr:Coenzyme F420 hydrogenase/dehydrogenase, beta subunit C-terminal domain [Euryarchaeota archaeon]
MANERKFPVCCYCGACAAFLPDFKKYEEEEIVFDKGCGGTVSKGFCFSFCPRSFAACRLCEGECPRMEYGVCDFSPCASSPEGRILGYYKEMTSARATDKGLREVGQDGSVITAMLYEALKTGFIDAAVVATRTEDWRAEPFVATTPEEVLLGIGPKYTACPSVLGVWEAIDRGYEKIAMVGTGCNVEAVRRLQALHDSSLELDRVKLLIGLFGTEEFWHRDLVTFLSEREGIDIREVERFYVSKGNFIVITEEKEFIIPTKDLDHCVRDTCRICEDFSSQLADVSAGSSGSPVGWTTLILRTKVGEELVNASASAGIIETKQMDSEGIKKMERFAFNKKSRNYGMIREQMEICSACLTNPYSFTLQLRGGV